MLNDKELQKKNAKQFSNNAQYIIAKHGNVLCRVLMFINLSMGKKTSEFYYSNEKIAQNIKSNKDNVSVAIQKLKNWGFINCSYDYNGVSRPRTITWAKNFDWNDISDLWKINSSMVDKNIYESSTKSSLTIDKNTKTHSEKHLHINNSINNSINNDFNKDKEKYKKIDLEKTK